MLAADAGALLLRGRRATARSWARSGASGARASRSSRGREVGGAGRHGPSRAGSSKAQRQRPEGGGLRDGGAHIAAGASLRAAGAAPRAASAQHRPQNHRAAPRAAPADRPTRFYRRRASRQTRRATAGSRRRCLPVGPRGSSASPGARRAPHRSAAPRRSRGVVPCPARRRRRRRRWLAGRSFFSRSIFLHRTFRATAGRKTGLHSRMKHSSRGAIHHEMQQREVRDDQYMPQAQAHACARLSLPPGAG